jgi:hypothetical protein
MSSPRFPPPWTVEEMEACFVVRDATRVTPPTKWTQFVEIAPVVGVHRRERLWLEGPVTNHPSEWLI